MATELGQAYVQIMPSAKGISGSISKQIDPESKNAGTKAGGSIAGAIKGAIVAAGIGAVIGKAINAGGELQQNLGGTEAVFGNFAGSIQNSAQDAYKNMGLSASDYMATANKMGSLFQGSGVKQERALELTSTAMQRAADVASVMGLDTTAAMESIAGAAKGNFTMMDNLGVAMNATTLEAYALEKGINFDWKTADNAEKSELAMKMFMDRTTQYAGNFAKESEETFSGSLGAMKSSFTDMLAALSTGNGLPQALKNLSGTVVTFAKNLIPMISNVVRELPTMLVTLVAETGPELLQAGMTAIGEIASGIGQALPTLIPMALEAILALSSTFVANLPMLIQSGMDLIVGLAQGIMDAIPIYLDKAPEIINNLVTSLLDKLPEMVQTGVELLTALIADMPTIIQTILDVLPGLIENLITALLDNLPLIVQSGIDLFTALITAMPQILTTIAKSLPKIVNSIADTLLDNIDTIIQAGVDLLTALVTNLPKIILELAGSMPEIITSMVSALGDGITKFAKIGEDLIKGLWQGIKDVGGWLRNKISGFFGGVVDSIKNFFGIHSPSKMFAGIGGNLGEGLAVGITGSAGIVNRAMDELGGIAERSFAADFILNASSNGLGLSSGLSATGLSNQQQTGASTDPGILQLVVDSRLMGEAVLPVVSRGMAVQRINMAMARG